VLAGTVYRDRLAAYLAAKRREIECASRKKLTAAIFRAANVSPEEATPAVMDAHNVALHVIGADFGTWADMCDPASTESPIERDAKRAFQVQQDAVKRFNAISSPAVRVHFMTLAAVPVLTHVYDDEHNMSSVIRADRVLKSLNDPSDMRARCARLMAAIAAIVGAAQLHGGTLTRLAPEEAFATMLLVLDGRRGGVSAATLDQLRLMGMTMGSKRTQQVMAYAAKLVRATFVWEPSADGSRPMAAHTADNMDMKPDHHYILTNLVLLGMMMTAEEVRAFTEGFATLPDIDAGVDLGMMEKTPAEEAALEQCTTIPHCILALWAAVRLRRDGFDSAEKTEDVARDLDPEQLHAAGALVAFDSQHRTLQGSIVSFESPHYAISVPAGDGRAREYSVHANNVRAAAQPAAAAEAARTAGTARPRTGDVARRRKPPAGPAAAAAPAASARESDRAREQIPTLSSNTKSAGNPDGLDPFAAGARFGYDPTESLATSVTRAHSKHRDATASMYKADAATTRDFDGGAAPWSVDFEFYVSLFMLFWTSLCRTP
jgi:hypothetical protein